MRIQKFAFFFLLMAFSITAEAQTADEIVAKYVAFTGGLQKWKSITSIVSSGMYNYGGISFPFKAYSKSPDLYEYTVIANGKSFKQGYNGRIGWRIDGFKDETKKTILTGKDALAIANESDVALETPFINYKHKGFAVTLEGKDTVDKKPCFKIKLTRKNGDTENYFFDSNNFALIKKQAVSKNTELDKSMLDIFFSDYHFDEGFNSPHKITYTANGQEILIITVDQVKLNEQIDNSIFQP